MPPMPLIPLMLLYDILAYMLLISLVGLICDVAVIVEL
jgi:hypothetical protein